MYPTKTFWIRSCIQRMVNCDVILNAPPPLQNPGYASDYGYPIEKRQSQSHKPAPRIFLLRLKNVYDSFIFICGILQLRKTRFHCANGLITLRNCISLRKWSDYTAQLHSEGTFIHFHLFIDVPVSSQYKFQQCRKMNIAYELIQRHARRP